MKTISKKKNKISIQVIGGNCESVTGSSTLINFENRNMIFELGMIQDKRTILDNYNANKNYLAQIKPSTIEYLFIGHCHHDHIGAIPYLYSKENVNTRIIAPKGMTSILKEMWLDSAFINQRDCDYLSLKYKKHFVPFYTPDEVQTALSFIEEYESNEIIVLDENTSFRYTPAGHILGSQQTELFITINNNTKKIVFTSDLGNKVIENNKFFVEKFQPISKANIVFGECTYSARGRAITKKDLDLDVNKIKTVIEQFCIDNNRRVLIPTFSLDRMPLILWMLYNIYGQDEKFSIPILVDSPLAIRLLKCYGNILTGEAKIQFDKIMNWKNIKFISEPEESKAAIADTKAKIICSSSGMLQAGRSVKWTQSILPISQDCILFIGYCATNTLAHQIKNSSCDTDIKINNTTKKNRCHIVDLHSFSSHMQREDLINYYKSFTAEKIYLIHSDSKSKLEFKEDLEKAISDCCKTTKVVAVNRSTVITL